MASVSWLCVRRAAAAAVVCEASAAVRRRVAAVTACGWRSVGGCYRHHTCVGRVPRHDAELLYMLQGSGTDSGRHSVRRRVRRGAVCRRRAAAADATVCVGVSRSRRENAHAVPACHARRRTVVGRRDAAIVAGNTARQRTPLRTVVPQKLDRENGYAGYTSAGWDSSAPPQHISHPTAIATQPWSQQQQQSR
jgi:hypothetical protein